MGRGLFPPPPQTRSTSIVAFGTNPLWMADGESPRLQGAYQGFAKSYTQGVRTGNSTLTRRGYTQVRCSAPHLLFSHPRLSIKSAFLSTGGCCSLKAGKLAVSHKPHPVPMLTFAFRFSPGLGFLSTAFFFTKKPPQTSLLTAFTCDFASLYNQFFKML